MSKNDTRALKKSNSFNTSNKNNSCNSNKTIFGGNDNFILYSSSNSYPIKISDNLPITADCTFNSIEMNRVKIEPDLESEEIQVSLNPKLFFNSNKHVTGEHSYIHQTNDVNISKTRNNNSDFVVTSSNSAISFVSIVNPSKNSFNESVCFIFIILFS